MKARALFAGIAAHSKMPLDKPGKRCFRIIAGGGRTRRRLGRWRKGGSQQIAEALRKHFVEMGGEVETGPGSAFAWSNYQNRKLFLL